MRYSQVYRVLADQVDVTNHLSNVQYYEFFKSTLFSFLHKNNFSALVKPKDLWPVVFNESCEFHKEVLFDQEVKVEIFFDELSEKKNKWLCIGIMSHITTGEKIASWKSFHGIMNRKTRKIESLTEKAANLIRQYTQASSMRCRVNNSGTE